MREFIDFVSASADTTADTEAIAAAAACLDRFTAAFNARDLAGMDRELHFPHVMLSGAEHLVWDRPGQHPANLFSALEGTGWACTRYEEKLAILASADKVHFALRYTRRDKAGSVLSEHRNVWIVTRVAGKWGIALRSY
ncbi:hypothetical protein HHL11_10185 [Ramlibacter sp. G-1-2-2]|uniref:DUF4440 domain-containing protein n=1 Tax=Ramlibacter agri TaxID=2728837 RepID=A0A848H8Y5_9BURK|nr:hypothetical protein [Ramlibacter agri]NML44118.1 hypothetical protein [Ramlibacter agri]